MSEATTGIVASFTELLIATVTNYMRDVFGGPLPGRIQSYDASKRLATVEILLQDVEETRLGRTVSAFPILNGVPIIFPGRTGALIEWTPQRGDTVLVMQAPRSIDRYKMIGGLVDPDDVRMHDFSDAIAFPVASFDAAHISSASTQIKFTDTTIEAGGNQALALNAKLSELKTAISNTVIVATDGGASFKTTLLAALASWPGTGTTKLKGG